MEIEQESSNVQKEETYFSFEKLSKRKIISKSRGEWENYLERTKNPFLLGTSLFKNFNLF